MLGEVDAEFGTHSNRLDNPIEIGVMEMQGWENILFLVIMFVLFYVLLILPQNRQAKRRAEMLKAIKAGDEIETGAGVLGRVVSTSGEQLIVNIGTREEVLIKMNVGGVRLVLTPKDEASKNEDKEKKS